MTDGTAPQGSAPDGLPAADPTHLHAHLGHCAAARGALHRLRGALAVVDSWVQPRFLSTLAALALALAAWAALWSGPPA